METMRNRVLDTIVRHGPITVSKIMDFVVAEDKQVRSARDALRALKEPVWFDEDTGAFWRRNDIRPSGDKYRQWKERTSGR